MRSSLAPRVNSSPPVVALCLACGGAVVASGRWWLVLQVGEYRGHAAADLGVLDHTEFEEDRADVFLHGRLGQMQGCGDTCVVLALRHLAEDVELTGGEMAKRRVRGVGAGSDQRFHDSRIDGRSALGDGL